MKVTRDEAMAFVESAMRNWAALDEGSFSDDDLEDLRVGLEDFLKRKTADTVEIDHIDISKARRNAQA